MNTPSNYLSRAASTAQRLVILGLVLTASAGVGRAANTVEFWDPSGGSTTGGAGTWDAGSTVAWSLSSTGGSATVWPQATGSTTTADFAGTAGSVSLGVGANINVNSITFGTAGYTIQDTAGDTTAVLNFGTTATTTGTINFGADNSTINAQIVDSGSLTLTGSAALNLGGNNTGLTGTVVLNGGTIGVSDTAVVTGTNPAISNGFGTATIQAMATTAINYRNSGDNTHSAQVLDYGNNININTTGSLTFNIGQVTGGASSNKTFSFGNVTFNSAGSLGVIGSLDTTGTAPLDKVVFSGITLAANGTFIQAASGGSATVGAITQSGATARSFTFTGSSSMTQGSLVINGASSYTGATFINEGTLQDGITNALPTATALTLGSTNGGVATLDLNGFSQTVGAIATAGTTTNVITNSSATAGTLTYTGGTPASTFNGNVTGSKLGLSVTAGTLILSGTNNTYGGATSVSGGQLTVAGTGTITTSAVTISGGVLNVLGKSAGTVALDDGGTLSGSGGTIGALTVAGGGVINTVDAGIGTLNGTTHALNGNATLDMEISTGSTSDLLNFSGAATVGSSDAFTVNVTALNGVTTGTYTIATALSGLTAADFNAGTLTNLTGETATFTLSSTGDSIELIIQSANPASNNYYFTGGDGSNSFTDAGNFSTTADGTTSQTGNALSGSSNVFLDASSASNTPPTLSGTATINSLTYVTAGETLAGNGSTLTVMAGSGTGITDSATGGTTETIQPTVALGASQSWTVSNSTNTLTVAGGVSGTSAQTLTLNGPGSFNFTSGSTGTNFAGNTTVASGSLFINNGNIGSALGSGVFTVNRGATFGGAGTATGLSSFVIGAGSSGTAQVQVGSGGTNTSSKLTLTALNASSITSTNLTFNLNSTTNVGANAGNQLNLGNTTVTFSNSTLTLNLVGGTVVAANTAYVLITDADGFQGLDPTGPNNRITTGLSIAASTFFGAESNGFSTGFYNGSYLFLSGDGTEIEVEIVPEPGTWALMLGGFGFLFFWQRRRSAVRI